jgi:predicted dehydrogenase
MLQIAVIGCGKIAQVRHLPEYAANPNVRLAGYYDFNQKRAEEVAEKYGGIAYRSVEELLAEPSIDAVSVCVANNAHAKISIAALNAGKHVLCEKPMAVTLKDCEAMVEASRKNKRFLMIGQNQRLARAHVKAKELLEQGAIGDVITFRTTFGHGGPETWSIDPGRSSWFFDKKRATMGALADLGVHKTDLIQFLLEERVTATTAKITTLEKRDANGNLIGVDDNAVCIYRMEHGIVGTMTVSWTFYGREDNSTVLYGTKGIMRIYDDPVHSIIINFRSGERAMYDLGGIQTNDNQTKSGVIDAFVGSLLNKEEPAISGSSVLPAMRAIFASIESSKTGRMVEISGNEEKRQ